MADEKPREPEVLPAAQDGGKLAESRDEARDHLDRIRSLLPHSPPSATQFFISLWIARREVKAREAAADVIRAERELIAEFRLHAQELDRAKDIQTILDADRADRQALKARAELAALQAKNELEAYKKARKAPAGTAPQDAAKSNKSRVDHLKDRLFYEARTTAELQVAADEEIARIERSMERGEISRDAGSRLIENIRDSLEKLLEEL